MMMINRVYRIGRGFNTSQGFFESFLEHNLGTHLMYKTPTFIDLIDHIPDAIYHSTNILFKMEELWLVR